MFSRLQLFFTVKKLCTYWLFTTGASTPIHHMAKKRKNTKTFPCHPLRAAFIFMKHPSQWVVNRASKFTTIRILCQFFHDADYIVPLLPKTASLLLSWLLMDWSWNRELFCSSHQWYGLLQIMSKEGPKRHRPMAHPVVFRYISTLAEHAVHRLRRCPAIGRAGTCFFLSVQLDGYLPSYRVATF